MFLFHKPGLRSKIKTGVLFAFAGVSLMISNVGCESTNSSSEGKVRKASFFDIKEYFEGEVKKRPGRQQVKKTTVVNGAQEERELDSLNFSEEIKTFSNSDINRPAWSDKYEVDSIYGPNRELIGLDYKTLDTKLKTKRILIEFAKGEVAGIVIKNSTSSLVSKTDQLLEYKPMTGYSIESKQKVLFLDENSFLVQVLFL